MKGITSTSPVVTNVPQSEMGESFTYDPDFCGPVKERSCTDVICLFLFISFLAGWVVIAVFALKNGNPSILINPTDTFGNICGMDSYKDKPYLYFFDLTKCASPKVLFSGCPTPQVCVSACPNDTYFFMPDTATEADRKRLICIPETDQSKPVSYLIEKGFCASLYLKSSPLVKRCIPDAFLEKKGVVLDDHNKTVKDKDGEELKVSTLKKASKMLAQFLDTRAFSEKVFSDFEASWKEMLVGLFLSMVLCFIWILLMRWFAGFMVWFSIFAVTGLSGFACYYSVNKYMELKNSTGKEVKFQFTTNLSSYLAMKNTWLIFGIIAASVLLFMLILLIFLRKRLFIAIALIKEASRAVSSMMTTLLFPILPYLLQLAVIGFWILIALYIESSGQAKYVIQEAATTDVTVKDGDSCDPKTFNLTNAKCHFKAYESTMAGSQFYNLFAMLWGVFFAIGIGELSIAGAFAAYYWTKDKSKDVPKCAIFLGFWRCLRYHMGSVAFGSLLIATVKFIRICLEYIDQKCKKYDNAVTRGIMCCLKCCFWCLEKFIKFISKNAYIMIAVYGDNFCTSAKNAFMLLLRNAVRVFVLDKVTDFLLLIGKLAIVGAAAAGSFMVFTSKIEALGKFVPTLNYNLLPVIVITFGAYVIASIFFNVYGMAVDTLFLCFLEDLERNDGSPSKPYYMSKELMKILDKRNKFREPAK